MRAGRARVPSGGDQEGSGREPARRHDVIAALRRHGISGTVAAALWTTARDPVRRTRRRGIEHAVTLDAESGQPIGPMLTGTATATDVSRHILAFRPGHGYVVLHTHPRSTSFSPEDVLLLADHLSIRAIIAVGIDGAWHVLSRLADTNLGDPFTLVGDARRERLRLEREGVPPAEWSHLAAERIASRYGLVYDRVVG